MPWYPTTRVCLTSCENLSINISASLPFRADGTQAERLSPTFPSPFGARQQSFDFFLHFPLIILSIHGSLTNTIRNILIFVFAPFMKVIVNDKLGKDSIVFVCLFLKKITQFLGTFRFNKRAKRTENEITTIRSTPCDTDPGTGAGRRKKRNSSENQEKSADQVKFHLIYFTALSLSPSRADDAVSWMKLELEWMNGCCNCFLPRNSERCGFASISSARLKAYRFSSVAERLSWMKWDFGVL